MCFSVVLSQGAYFVDCYVNILMFLLECFSLVLLISLNVNFVRKVVGASTDVASGRLSNCVSSDL